MNVQKNEKYTLVVLDAPSLDTLHETIKELEDNHLVLEVSENININDSEISLFLNFASHYKTNGMSFVVVKLGIDIDAFPETINIVPTLQEAEDILEMEAIERDLGF